MTAQLREEAPYIAAGISPATYISGSVQKITPTKKGLSSKKKLKFDGIISQSDTQVRDQPPIPPTLIDRSTPDINIEVADIDELPPNLAKTLCPQESIHVANSPRLPTLAKAWTKKGQEAFLQSNMNDHTRALVNQKFGKPSLTQCFKSEATFRHVLPILFRLGFLDADDAPTRSTLVQASPACATLYDLYDDLKDVDFNSLREPRRMDTPPDDEIDLHRVRQSTAALLYFDGNAATFVRWLGGLHVGAFRDVPAVLAFLDNKIDPSTHAELRRMWTKGIPRQCNAETTEENFQAYVAYGNHSSVIKDIPKMKKTLVKDANRDQVLIFDRRVFWFVINCHVTPTGLVNFDKPGKKARCVFDSSFHPIFYALAINDMTTKYTEPPILETNTEIKIMVWFWRCRAQYPLLELYPMDDDGALAFRQLKYPPELVALHTSLQNAFTVMNTGGTFGDNTTPNNWDVVVTARRQLAQWLWKHCPNAIDQVRHLLPQVKLASPPTPAEVASFMPAEFDSINKPIVSPDGVREPPPHNHQVDDNLCAEVAPFVEHTLACSALALYIILGFPGPYIPDLLSKDKLDTYYTHQRVLVGRWWNTRTMEVGMLPAKRALLIPLLEDWTRPKKTFTVQEAASLLGQLEDHIRYVRWAHIWIAPLHNEFKVLFLRCYYAMRRRWASNPQLEARYEIMSRDLPRTMEKRLQGIIAKEQASFLWKTNNKAGVSDHLRISLQAILSYLRSSPEPFREYIGFIIDRDPHFKSLGDASGVAGGACFKTIPLWFQIIWSDDVRRRANGNQKDPTHIHINCLEFVIVILQLAAAITWLRDAPATEHGRVFPKGLPPLPILATWSDNLTSVAWGEKHFTSSHAGQHLLAIYSSILREHCIRQRVYHIPGKDNLVADDISRPTDDPSDAILADPAALLHQIYQKNPFLKTYSTFRPSPELLHSLTSALYTTADLALPSAPKQLGQLAPAGSIGSILHV